MKPEVGKLYWVKWGEMYRGRCLAVTKYGAIFWIICVVVPITIELGEKDIRAEAQERWWIRLWRWFWTSPPSAIQRIQSMAEICPYGHNCPWNLGGKT